jgi:hypothetical protein
VVVALAVSGAAVAATQLLPTGPPVEQGRVNTDPRTGAGVVEGRVRLLSVRADNPAGGPPWALRVFRSSRGGSCVQLGRVSNGRFGLVLGSPAAPTFRPLQAVPGENSLCGGVERGGFPVLRGLRRIEQVGGNDSRAQPGGSTISAAFVIRYGLLGPKARRATFSDPGTGVRRTQILSAAAGGAYLFVVPIDPAQLQAAQRRGQASAQAFDKASAQARKEGLTGAAFDRRRLALLTLAASKQRHPSSGITRPTDRIDATFADGTTLRVAGPGRTTAALPGVTRHAPISSDTTASLQVQRSGDPSTRHFLLSFRAPRAITTSFAHYTVTLKGPYGPDCVARSYGGGQATTRDIAAGERLSFRVHPSQWMQDAGRKTWCPGRYTVHVGYQTTPTPFRGQTVAKLTFNVPAR